MISTSKHVFEFEADKFELIKLSYSNGENVFYYRVAYSFDVAYDTRSRGSTNRYIVHSTHNVESFENSYDLELDVSVNSVQSITNGLTTVSASATFENVPVIFLRANFRLNNR